MVLVVFLLLFVARSISLLAPRCHHEQSLYNCSSHHLNRVPEEIPQVVTELDLSFNQLEAIMDEDLSAYDRLRSLIVSNNRIQTIQDDALVSLNHLEKLDVSFNHLATLSSRWFRKLSSLQSLNLLGNKYQTLGPGDLFRPLSRLRRLHLGGPFLRSVKRKDFSSLSGLEELILDGRNLQGYEKGSLEQVGAISRVTLNLNGVFETNPKTVHAILSDAVHPNTTLTLTDTFFKMRYQMSPFRVASNLGGIVFRNVTMSAAACIELLKQLSDSNLTMLTIEDAKFLITHEYNFVGPLHFKNLKDLIFKNVNIDWFYKFPALDFLQPLMVVVQKVSVLNSNLFLIPCQNTVFLTKLKFLDISDNIVNDVCFDNMMCDGSGVMSSLETINVSRNHLESLNSRLFTKLPRLKNIDMSGNKLGDIPETCHWPESLRFLNLSSTLLTKVTRCLPTSLQILDLSNNKLTVFDIELPLLTDLHLSGNRIASLPQGRLYPLLTFLSIQNNQLHTLSSGDLQGYRKLARLQAAKNPYVCSCDFVAFVKSDLMNHQEPMTDVFESYTCGSPDAERGKRVSTVRLSVFECRAVLAFSLLCSGILALCLLTAALCYRFSVVWYLRMTCAWLKAKRKPKLKKRALEFDAFVSYSDMDSRWVEAHLVPELEESDPPLRLCLHKRDFVPGGWILDNIMDAIEKSHRTLFILSQHFVRSEWCKYELDYTHFRLFDQNDDSVVLVLLEPIDKNTVPKKFSRLRRAMNARTYLEWPDNDEQIPVFWQSLRTTLRRPEAVMEANEEETVNL